MQPNTARRSAVLCCTFHGTLMMCSRYDIGIKATSLQPRNSWAEFIASSPSRPNSLCKSIRASNLRCQKKVATSCDNSSNAVRQVQVVGPIAHICVCCIFFVVYLCLFCCVCMIFLCTGSGVLCFVMCCFLSKYYPGISTNLKQPSFNQSSLHRLDFPEQF